jgi:hypothetical protein
VSAVSDAKARYEAARAAWRIGRGTRCAVNIALHAYHREQAAAVAKAREERGEIRTPGSRQLHDCRNSTMPRRQGCLCRACDGATVRKHRIREAAQRRSTK